MDLIGRRWQMMVSGAWHADQSVPPGRRALSNNVRRTGRFRAPAVRVADARGVGQRTPAQLCPLPAAPQPGRAPWTACQTSRLGSA